MTLYFIVFNHYRGVIFEWLIEDSSTPIRFDVLDSISNKIHYCAHYCLEKEDSTVAFRGYIWEYIACNACNKFFGKSHNKTASFDN